MLKLSFFFWGLAFATQALAYIDPNTTQTVVSSLGALLATIGATMVFAGAMLRVYATRVVHFVRGVFRHPLVSAGGRYVLAVIIGGVLYGSFNYFSTKGDSMSLSATSTPKSDKRMLILGIDGMDPKLAKKFMDEGKLPNFKRLAEQGDFKQLMTVNPVQSPVVWATMATGVGPGVHGIADFITRKENSYVPELSLVKRLSGGLLKKPEDLFAPPVDARLFFWEKLVGNGVSSKVLRWPLTFPASGDATILAGLGTPDLLGGMGTYTLFTTDRSRFPSDVKGTVVPMAFEGGRTKVRVVGPKKSTLMSGVTDSSIDLLLEKAGGALKLTMGTTSWTMQSGELSAWIPMSFPVGLGNKLTGMVQFLVLENGDNVDLYMSPIQIDPMNPAYPIASKGYGKNLVRDVGRFHTLGMAEDTNALADEIIDEAQFLKICEGIMQESEDLFFHELANGDSQFFSFVFDTLDRIQHMFWRFQDPEHPLYDAMLAKTYGGVIESYYQRMDRILGRLGDSLPNDATLLVVSDHGFTSYRRNFHANSWLIENGYMTLQAGHSDSSGLFEGVDWSKTKAFALGFSQIFINVKGRDDKGIVEPADMAALKAEISQKLAAVLDPGASRAVVRVYDAADVYGMTPPMGPDLLVGMQAGYRFSWQTAVGGAPHFVFEDNDKRWSGDHCVDPEHVPGVIFSNRKLALSHPSVIDVAPTALDFFGVDRLDGMLGKNLFAPEARHARANP